MPNARRILVIDDEPDILETLKLLLEQAGYAVTTASNGSQALALIQRQEIDLVMTDMRMPGMDGAEVIRRVKELDPDMEAIVLTGHASLENAVAALRSGGAFDYLSKPLDNIDGLLSTVEKAMEKRRLRLENRALLTDLTEKKRELARQNQALRENELLKQAIMDGIASMICFVDLNMEVLWANRAMLQSSRISLDELIGRKCLDVWEPEDAPPAECPLTRAAATGQPEQAVVKYRGGRIMDVRVVPVSSEGGQPVGYLHVAEDVTKKVLAEGALRASERKYRELADSLPVYLFETDAGGKVTFLNPHALDGLGYSHDDFEQGLSIRDLIGIEHQGKIRKDVRKSLVNKDAKAIDTLATRKDGTQFPVLLNVYPNLEGGRIVGLRGFAVEITEQKQRQEEMARIANLESLGTLAGGIAHDFNNLLSIILGNIEVANWKLPPGSAMAAALEKAETGCLKAMELTGQFLVFSEGGSPKPEVADLEALLRETVPLPLSGSNVKCEYRISGDLHPAHLDKRQIGQVILNLVQNAVEAMPAGGTVRVCADNLELAETDPAPVPDMPAGRYLRLGIQDEGGGMSDGLRARAFDPYFTTKKRGARKGTGMGLPTTLTIVRKHGGFMRMDSGLAAGTSVWIYLPAVAGAKRPPVEPAIRVSGEDSTLPALKVLVMEDDDMLRMVAQEILEQLGHRAETARDGHAAVAAYRAAQAASEPFDVVMLDLTIRGGPGGEETIAELLKLNPDLKAVVCSGYADNPVMQNYRQYGFGAALDKPFKKDSLTAALKKALV